MSRLFGTDGVRGIAGTELTCNLAMNIGSSLGYLLNKKNKDNTVIIGSDTRISKDMLVSSLSAGLCSQGINVINLGIIPTPAISYLVEKMKVNAGIMVTASHNPYQFNGIKIFDSNGLKLEDSLEDEIENILKNNNIIKNSDKIGTITYDNTGLNLYIDHLLKIKTTNYNKIKICIDCANGASSITAPILFEKLNCNYHIINKNYNGLNINDNCGSTHLEALQEYVIKNNYDLGIAFDGDADRCLLIDHKGNIRDGDYILAIMSKYLNSKKILKKQTVVGTVMSNLGFIKYCEANKLKFISTKVGDRYVLEEMNNNNYNLGGEQSGHIIFKDYAKTGDGQLTAINILNVIATTKTSLYDLSKIMTKYPQVMVNIKVPNEKKNNLNTNPVIKKELEKVEKLLVGNGRLLVRPSGTEPLIRVMIEGENIDIITAYANDLAKYIEKNL